MSTMTHPQSVDVPAKDRPFDPYALSAEAIEDPPASLWVALRHIGPGLILAGSIVGTGELIATTNLGAKVGFSLLWLVLVSCFIKVFVQVELGRHAISSGETSIESFARLPGPGMLFVWWFVVMTLVTQFQLGAMIGGVGQALHMTFPSVSEGLARALGWAYLANTPELTWCLIVTIVTIVLLAKGSYRLVESGTTIMVVIFTLMTVACVLLLPASNHPIPWDRVREGLKFTIPAGAFAAAFAMFGITGVGGSELVAYPYWCIEKGYARKSGPRPLKRRAEPPPSDKIEYSISEGGIVPDYTSAEGQAWIERARGWLRIMRLDAWVSMLVYTLATISFYFLGAAAIHKPGMVNQGLPTRVGPMLNELAGMYSPVMGARAALVFIVVGAFAVLYSTLFSSTASNSRALTDALRVSNLVRINNHNERRKWIRNCCIFFPIVDLILYLQFKEPVLMVIIGGFAQALTLPMIGIAAVYLRYRRTDPRLTAGKVWDFFLWLSLLGLCTAAAVGLYNVYGKITGR